MTYSLYCFRPDKEPVLLKSNLSLETVQWICKLPHTSSQTSQSPVLIERWGPGPWFYGYEKD